MTDSKDYMKKYDRDLKESKEESKKEWDKSDSECPDQKGWDETNECPDQKGWDETNFNPEAFKEVDKKYEEEEKLLSKLRFKSEEDKYVFNALPLLPTQKLEIIYQLIIEKNDCIEVDEDLRKDILKITQSS